MKKRRLTAILVSMAMLLNMNSVVLAAESAETSPPVEHQTVEKETVEISSEKDEAEVTEKSEKAITKEKSEKRQVKEAEKSDTEQVKSTEANIAAYTSSSDLVSGDFTYTVSGTKATITGYTGSGGSVTVPETIGGYTVTKIAQSSFIGTRITSVNLPKTVTEIGSNAFSGCTTLKTVKMEYNSTVEYAARIEGAAFSGCTSLTSVGLSENVTSIGDRAFSGCTALESLTLPESLKSMGYRMIESTAISEIAIPKNVISCGVSSNNGPLANCKTLKTVTFEEGMTAILGHMIASNDSSNVEKVVIPESVTAIGNSAFYGCDKITIYGYPGSYAQQYAEENNIPFKEYNGLYTDEIKNDSYGVPEYEKTRAGNVYDAVWNYTSAIGWFYSNTTDKFKTDYRTVCAAPSNFKQLRAYDETAADRKTNQLLTISANAPTEAVDDAYEVLYDFLKKCMQTGVDEKLIDLNIDSSQSAIEIESKVIKKVYDAIQEESGSFKGTGSNGFKVELVKTGIFGQSFGSVTISGGKGKISGIYSGMFCSDGKQ